MGFSEKRDYSEIAKKISKMLKEGIGISEIINLAYRNSNILNKSNYNFSEKND